MHTPIGLASDLRTLGLGRSATVMVHASLRSIGPVEGGADGLLGAILDVIGPGGTMMMVLGSRDDHAWVNDRPEAERAALLADAIPFDPFTTPADPDVGTLAEVFRRYPGTVVGDHPEARFGACGVHALEMVTNVAWNDYFGAGSPLERLVDAGGVVLRMGADPDTTTLLHHAEYLATTPAKRRVRRHRLVKTPAGPEIQVVDSLDDTNGIVDHPGPDYFVTILEGYIASGRAATGVIGSAPSQLLDSADLTRFAVDWMNVHLGQ